MNKKQEQALTNIRSILKRHFSQSLISVVYADSKTMEKKIFTMDYCANDAQSEHLASTTLSNIEVLTCGLIKTVFDTGAAISHPDKRVTVKRYND